MVIVRVFARLVLSLLVLSLGQCTSDGPNPSLFTANDFELVIVSTQFTDPSYRVDYEVINKTNRPYTYASEPRFDVVLVAKATDGAVYIERVGVPELDPNSRKDDGFFVGTSGKQATITATIERSL